MGLFTWDHDQREYVYRPGNTYDNVSGRFWPRDNRPDKTNPLVHARHGVLKLHGSLSWSWRGSGKNRQLVVAENLLNAEDAEIIFAEPEKLRMVPPYNDLFYAFSVALGSSKALIIIGYSWGDTHINRLIEYEVHRGLSILEISLFEPDMRLSQGFLPPETIFIRATARAALSGQPVEVAVGSSDWRWFEGGLPAIVQKMLHTQFWKTEEEWQSIREKNTQ